MQDWLTMTAADLGRGLQTGDIGAVALAEAYLGAMSDHPLRDRIYARTTPDRALAEARASEARAKSGHRLSPLDGVPVSWKDVFDTAGVPTESGSKLLAGRTPGSDARVLRNATAMGLVCLGKTHQTELAFSGLGYNPMTATPPCVNDPDAVPGGSSSGAAASVAFGLAASGIGSDTGGSVRVPSVWNDLVGLKTTAGRVSLEGVVPLCARFDTVGPLCRSVEDAALILAALEGRRPADLRGASLAGTRFLILDTVAFDGIENAPAAGFEQAVGRLVTGGAAIDHARIPDVAEAMALAPILFATEAYGTWMHAIEADPEAMFPQVLERFRGGRDFAGCDYVASWHTLDRLRAAYAEATRGYDAVLVPTCAILPPKVSRVATEPDYFVSSNLMTLRNTRIGNLMGVPALTLPAGVPSTGISLMTPPGTEDGLLRLGAAAEAALA